MNPILKNVLAVILGIIIGGCINMGIIIFGTQIVPPPAGVDVMDPESFKANIHLFQARHFAVPFLAHAIGTFVGALVTYCLTASHKLKLAYLIGASFLVGGIMASMQIPAPKWFIALDLLLAYIPMAWLGVFIGVKLNKN